MKMKETWDAVNAIPSQIRIIGILVFVSAVLSVLTFVMMIGMASHAH